MKQAVILLVTGLMLLVPATQAQKSLAEATLQYDISIQPKAGATAAGSLQGAGAVFYVKGVYSRSDMFSSLGNEKTIHDARQGTAAILKEYSGQKLMITLTKENWVEKNKQSEGISFTDQPETKEIAGYNCQKASARLNDGSSIITYYTPDLVMSNRDYNPLFKNLKGVPLYYEVESGNLKFIYTLRSIDFSTIPQSRFDLPKAGYRVMSYDESRQEGKGK